MDMRLETHSEVNVGKYTFVVTSNFKDDGAPTIAENRMQVIESRLSNKTENKDDETL